MELGVPSATAPGTPGMQRWCAGVLGYAGAIAVGHADFGSGSGTVYNYNSCSGNEDSLLDCGPGSVSSGGNVGVICRTQSK